MTFTGALKNNSWINLGLDAAGYMEGRPVDKNLILAIVVSCNCSTQTLYLVIWNTQTQGIVATIAKAVDVMGNGQYVHRMDTAKSGQSVVLMKVERIGSYNGGYLGLSTKYQIPATGCLGNTTVTLSGNLNLNALDDDGNFINGMDVIIPSGSITIKGKSIGTAVLD